jgi:Ca-activated chloride channel family protein
MRFEYPHLLWFALLLGPGLIAFFWWSARRKQQLMKQFVTGRLLAQLTVGLSVGRQKARTVLLVATVLLLLMALARLQIGSSWEEIRSRGLDVVVAIDTSRSMLAADLAPNRLRRAQLAALDLKRLARGDRVGVVAFAGSAFLQCPLTLDDEAFRQSVEALDVTIIPQGGTALAEAIQAAKSAFKEGNDNHKIVVLFTDGEDHDGNALEAAKQAAKEGMRLFTIGVGTANGELLRTVDVQGRTEFVKDADGNAVKSRLNEQLLQDMAREGGGFFMLLRGANTMNLLYERGLAPLPKGEQASQRIRRHHERYQWLLGLALLLLLLEMFIPERQTANANKSGTSKPTGTPGPGPAVTARAALWLFLLSMPGLAFGSAGDGLKQYQKGRYERALTEYEQLLKKNPDDARLHFNAGTAALQNKAYDQAVEHLNSALVTQDLTLQQRSYYNLGNTQFRMGEDVSDLDKKQQRWEQALRSYDSALQLDPKDADAEFNKEWVKKRLEELKQQQQQQQKQDKQDKKDDQNKQQQSKQDQQQQQDKSKEQQDKEKEQQQKEDQQKQQQQQKDQQQKEQEKQQAGQQGKDKDKEEKKPGEEGKAQQEPGKEGEGEDGQPTRTFKMTPQQAVQLLEALKGEEKVMMFRPPLKTNRQDRVFKDW